jgi:hypothetical protein
MRMRRPFRRYLGVAAAAILVLSGLAGCNLDSLTGKKSSAGPFDCTAYQDARAGGTERPLLLVMLDLSSNSPDIAGRVASRVRPYLDVALKDGEYIRLVVSGGQDTGLTYSDCFHGDRIFRIHRRNQTREEKDLRTAGGALQTEIDHVVQKERISPQGSATALLGRINDEVNTLRSTPDVKIGPVTVLVWTDLLGIGQQSDCLNIDGKKASISIAEAVAKRCFSAQQLTPVSGAKIRFIGVNEGTATGPQQDLARYLRGELCRRISSDCA